MSIKLTVNDFVNIAKQYSIVRIEIAPEQFESLNPTPLNVTDVMDLMSLSLQSTLSNPDAFRRQFGNLIDLSDNISTQEVKIKLFDLLIEQGVVYLIRFGEYDRETLDAYRIYCQMSEREN